MTKLQRRKGTISLLQKATLFLDVNDQRAHTIMHGTLNLRVLVL